MIIVTMKQKTHMRRTTKNEAEAIDREAKNWMTEQDYMSIPSLEKTAHGSGYLQREI